MNRLLKSIIRLILSICLSFSASITSCNFVFAKSNNKNTDPPKSAMVDSYIKTVENRLLNAWSPAIKSKAKVELVFRINEKGNVTWVEVSDASSSTPVNTAAKDAVSHAQPFKALPPGLKYIDLKVLFASDVSASQMGGYCRPTRERTKRASSLYRQAFQLKKSGSLGQACRKLEEALDQSPFNFKIKEKYVEYLLEKARTTSVYKENYLHKALLALPRSENVKKALDEFWVSKEKDPTDFSTRASIARQYDINGKPKDALAEYIATWEIKQEPLLIPEINLAAKHAQAWKTVKKWQKLYDLRPSPAVTLSLSSALKAAGAYKKAASVFNKEFDEDPIELRKNELETVSKTKLSSLFPLTTEEKKQLTISLVKNRKRVVDYLAHATKTQKAVIRWTPGRFPLTVFVKNGRGVRGYKPIYNKFVIDAFHAWEKASKRRLSFVSVGSEKGANIVVTWTSKPQDLKGLSGKEQGITYFKYRKARKGNYTIDSARINILTVNRFRTKTFLGSTLMKSVILHELGHSLGISGHSPYRSDLMFPSLNPFKPVTTITPRDAATITRLYQGYEHQ